MLVRGRHFIRVFVRRISIEIEHKMPFYNLLKLLRKLQPPPKRVIINRAISRPCQQLDNAVGTNNTLPFLAVIFFVARVSRALLFIACRATETS